VKPIIIDQSVAKGRLIAAARSLLGVDQRELARLAGVAPSTISNAERGEVPNGTFTTIRKALGKEGVQVTLSGNGLALVGIVVEHPDDEDEE
jgi:transcriptional regulator with XRE-family HTH domain